MPLACSSLTRPLLALPLLLLTACHALAAPTVEVDVEADDIRGLRSFSGTEAGALLLTFQAAKAGTEDRLVAHYPIDSIAGGYDSATLRVPVAIWDSGPSTGTMGFYAFNGDGVVSTDEWDDGVLVEQLTGIDGVGSVTLEVDVTDELTDGVTLGKQYLSFVMRAGPATDRYFMGSTVGLPDSTLVLTYPVPEPAGGVLIALAALAAF